MLHESLDMPVLDIVPIYFHAWAALFEGQLYPGTAQYNSGSW